MAKRPSGAGTFLAIAAVLLLGLGIYVGSAFADGGSGWGSTTTTTATVIGGIGSGVGGIAAAFAARRSTEAAKASESSSEQIAKLARDSALALGRTMKPNVSASLRYDHAAGPGEIVVSLEGAWPAHDVRVRVATHGSPDLELLVAERLAPGEHSSASRIMRLPPPPSSSAYVERLAGSYLGIVSVVTLWFRDQNGTIRHERETEWFFPVDPDGIDAALVMHTDSPDREIEVP